MIAGFTGSQNGMSESQCQELEEQFKLKDITILHHGCCIGADEQAHIIACRLGIFTIGHPPTNRIKVSEPSCLGCDELLHPKPYLDRNRDIVDDSEILFVGPDKPEYLRSGTWSTKRYAQKMNKPFYILSIENPAIQIKKEPYKTMEIQTIDQAIGQTGIKICVYSPAGSGKTVLTSTANANTIILSAEAGLLSLKRAPDEVKAKIGIIPIKTLEDMGEAFSWLEAEKRCDWLMLDSVSEIAETVLDVKLQDNKDPRKAYGGMASDMMGLIRALRDIPFYNVLMTAKQTRIKDEYTGITNYVPMLPGKILMNQLAYMFDEMFALQVFPDEEHKGQFIRVLQTGKDISYECKDRSGVLDHLEPANIEHIANKINGKPIAIAPITEHVDKSQNGE